MHEPENATQKAKDLVRMAVNKAREIEPLERIKLKVIPKVLVIGGGITGMIAALNLASQKFETYLVEKEKEFGGHARHIYKTLEGGDVQKFLADIIERVKNNPLIHSYTEAEIETISGYIGNFKTSILWGKEKNRVEFEHGVVIVATGADAYQPKEYLYGVDERVMTQSEFERVLHETNKIKEINKIVMIQCVGSRNEEHPYCSKMCCSEAIKNALIVKELNPSAEIAILFRDIRTYGFKETYYRKAREKGVLFIRFNKEDLPNVDQSGDFLEIIVKTPKLGKVKLNSDILVLSVGIIANRELNEELGKTLKVPINDDNFFLEAHVKLRPVDFATEGVFVAGLAHFPKTIEDSISQANAAVSRACTILSKQEIEAEGKIATIDMARCVGCGMCIENCAYNAIELIEDRRFGRVASINQALCKGCGACSGNCRCSAIDILGFSAEQIFAMISGRL
jgi:heterodisulfide reductase subunit A